MLNTIFSITGISLINPNFLNRPDISNFATNPVKSRATTIVNPNIGTNNVI